MRHRLLQRQLKKLTLDETVPPDAAGWQAFLDRVSQTYTEMDQDRYLLERSLSISSAEMQELYEKLRQSSETRLAAERDLLRTLMDNLPDQVFVKDAEGRILVCNAADAQIMGTTPEQAVGKTVFDFYPPDLAARYHADDMAVIQSGQPLINREEPSLDPAGRPRWVQVTKVPLRDHHGQVVGLVGIGHDITGRKQMESASERRAAQLALINDIGRQIAAVLELDRLLERAASLIREQFGYHHVALFIRDPQHDDLVMQARAGDFVHLFPAHHRLKMGQGLVGWVGRHGETVLANDVDQEPRYINLRPDLIPTRSELSVPIRVGREVVGVLDVQSPHRQAFDENDVLVMETLAAQIAVAIQNARLFAEAQALATTVRELSTPVIQVWDQVLVLPLIGGIDEARAQRIMETLLQGVTQHQAQVVIIDVTGVPLIDSHVADYLLRTAQAAELLGARCVLTGISPEIAQSIVSLGLSLTKLTTLPNLQAGIRYALALLHHAG